MSLVSKIATGRRLWEVLGPWGFLQEAAKSIDWPTGRVTRHPNLTPSAVDISVVVPTLNGGPDLVALLDSLSCQTGCRLEILVLDSGSTDGSRELVARYPQAQWVPIPPSEFSHSGTRNRGVALAKSSLVFFTVQDAVLPDPTWLARLAAILTAENLGALATAETPRSDADAYARYSLDSHYRGAGLREGVTVVHSRWRGTRRQRFRSASIGNVGCLYRRELLLRFPFEGSFGEDFLLAKRLLRENFAVGQTSELKIVHSHTRPAFYGLQRTTVSRRLMGELGLARIEGTWTEAGFLALVSSLAWFFPDRWKTIERLDPRLMRWVLSLGVDLGVEVTPHQILLDSVREVAPYAEGDTEERAVLVLKALAARVGSILGGLDSSLWSTPERKKAVEGLANGV